MAELPAVTVSATASTARPANWKEAIAGAVAELDLHQIAISRRLTHAQRVQQALSMIDLAEQVAAYRLRRQHPEMGEIEALPAVRRRPYDF